MTDPFLKWAGGKRWLAASGELPVPREYVRYVEPFLGGGAMFFHLKPATAILSDINAELIELYAVVRDQPEALRRLMAAHQQQHSTDYYYSTRAAVPCSQIERAARTLYLNRTCWNGLYRVNLRGEFNVPIGTKTTVLFADETFEVASEALRGANLMCCDFETTIETTGVGDFIFIDPPYTVQHNLNGFLKYNERIFSWADQIRLRDCVAAAITRGAAVAVTNADHESVRALYSGICEYRQLRRSSVLAGDANRRGQTTEALFFVS
ncbi:DNA adenine methylase [Rhizorhabdus sp. FW153]|uniref:DNA adenine methylase n=1 Tax=Rhizorhabdus sp. FW153 TaxID=3400216 RepID=UPI003CF85DC8